MRGGKEMHGEGGGRWGFVQVFGLPAPVVWNNWQHSSACGFPEKGVFL